MALAEDFFDLFRGLPNYYSQRSIGTEKSAKGKLEAEYLAIHETITIETWEEHLNGYGLGIVPILENGFTSSFGVIDVDAYSNFNHAAMANKINELDLPLVCSRSKSGGCHLYCFALEPIPSALMRKILQTFCIK